MGLDRAFRSNVSPPRPSSLLLETNNNTLLSEAAAIAAKNAVNVNDCHRRRKKRRASEFCMKRFCGESSNFSLCLVVMVSHKLSIPNILPLTNKFERLLQVGVFKQVG